MARQENELAELAGGFIHDLKNQLSTLSLNLQLLAEDFSDAQSPRERRAFDRVERLRGECRRMVDISNDFLRFARVCELERTPSNVLVLVDELMDFFGPLARNNGIEIKSFVPTGLPEVLLDRSLFKQALLNLAFNAQQAMPEGGEITFTARHDGSEVVLEVIDTGKGMSPEVLSKAFKPFYSTRQGGTGLGLPTTKKIIEAHGGSITVDSARGNGTRFSIRLPISGVQSSETAGPATVYILNGRQVPLAEANVSVLDRGFLFGDGIYEVLRIYAGKPWLEEAHFSRLERSLKEMRFVGVDVDRLRKQMYEGLTAGKFREAVVYMQITRGPAPRAHAIPATTRPTELMWFNEIGDPYAEKRKVGVSVTLQPDIRWKRCDIKTVNLLGNVFAATAAKEGGHLEAILHTEDGIITEASHSSLFGVINGVVRTTEEGVDILPGVTRLFTLELIRELGLPLECRSMHRDELANASELILTGTSLEVCPVTRVDAQIIGTGQPGPVALALQEAYAKRLKAFVG